jgi:hypothetical protein
MRPTLSARLGLAALLLAPTALPAQQAFEGTVTYRMTAEGMTMTMTQMTKGSRVRTEMEMPGMPGPMYVLMNMESEVMQTVMPSMGMYMEVSMKQAMDQIPMTPELRESMNQKPEIERLGTTDEVAGIACQNYRFTQGDQEMEGCIATGMGFFMGGAGGGPPGQGGPLSGLGLDFSAFEREFKDGMLPLRMRINQDGTWSTLMEATAVERKSLDDSLFELPPGLRKMSMPGGTD